MKRCYPYPTTDTLETNVTEDAPFIPLYSIQLFKMLLSYDSFQTVLLVLVYVLIYNLSSLLLFFTLIQVSDSNFKTLFSFSYLSVSNVYTKFLSLVILSLAGVPPLLGFFSKVFIFILVSSAQLISLFVPLFVLLFAGLYFYIQNLRFLNSTNGSIEDAQLTLSIRNNTTYFTYALPLVFLIIFGVCYIDDLILLSAWVLL